MATRTVCWVAVVERCPCCGGRHTVWADGPFKWVPHGYECPDKHARCVVAGSSLVGRQVAGLPAGAVEALEQPGADREPPA
ncbi:MAG: hypothetical protein WD749_06505 [Phycisphaerales bacterium]